VQWQNDVFVRPSPATWSLFVFVGACVASVPLSGHRLDSALLTTKILAGALMFAVVEQLIGSNARRARTVLYAAVGSFVIPALVGLGQLLSGQAATRIKPNGYGSNALEGGSRVKGTFVHPNPFGTYLVLIFLVALALFVVTKRRQRLMWGIVTATSGALLLATYTRTAWAGALVGATYLGLRHSKAILVGVGVIVIAVLLAVPSIGSRLSDLGGSSGPQLPGVPSNSLSWRIGYWEELLPLTLRSPVTGVGIGTSQFEGAAIQARDPGQSGGVTALLPHSVFVQIAVETGLLGFGALIGVIACFALTLRRRVAAAAGGMERTLALISVALCLSVLVQMPTENLVDETVIYWYLAALGTFGLGAVLSRVKVSS